MTRLPVPSWAADEFMKAGGTALPEAAHEVNVRVRGLVAEVTVRRRFEVGAVATEPAGRHAVLELALPPSAELLESALTVGGAEVALRVPPVERGPPALVSGMGARVARLHIERAFPEDQAMLYLRYRAPLSCQDGRFVLSFPGSDESDDQAVQVVASARLGEGAARLPIGFLQIAGHPGTVRSRGAYATGAALAPARLPWQVVVGPADPDGAPPPAWALATRITGASTFAPAKGVWWVGVCRPRAIPAAGFPSRFYVVIDRSRSMGPAGLSLARATARGLIEVLPTSTLIDVAVFAHSPTWLFPIERRPTGEILDAMDDALSPGEMENGTALGLMLDALSVRLLSAASGFGPDATPDTRGASSWLALITDGALDENDVPRLPTAARRLADHLEGIALILTRPAGEEPLALRTRQALVALVAQAGGVVRPVSSRQDRGELIELADDLRRGGDLFNLRLEASGEKVVQDLQFVTWPDVLPPGAGVVVSFPVGSGWSPVAFTGQVGGRSMRLPALVQSFRLTTTRDLRRGSRGRRGVTSLVRPDPVRAHWEIRADSDTEVGRANHGAVVRGELDRAVLRNTISLSFLPRARACYLARKAADAASARLAGKLRLALCIERGEVMCAEVLESTLAHPGIEDCVRRAAFLLDVPRPVNRDQPAVALVNLVFRPAPTGISGQGALSAELDHELDVLMGKPAALPSPEELLRLGDDGHREDRQAPLP